MYQKAFITRMNIRSFLSMVSQLIEAPTKAVRSMGFASFLKVDLKQIPGKFSKWLRGLIPTLPHCAFEWAKVTVIIFDVYVTLGVPIRGREIMEITRSSMDEEYDEVHAARKIKHSALDLTRMPKFILAKKDRCESFKRNFIIYLRTEEPLLQQVHLEVCQRCESNCIPRLMQVCTAEVDHSVRQHKESKYTKGVHFDGPLFFLMMLYLDRWADGKTEMENKDNSDKSPENLPQKEHLSQEPTQKPKKKKMTNKKGKIESKSNEELTSKKHAHGKQT
ncbi:LOW QUALITY PROTEIN: hypothetical protein Cgig2_028214 [Carnegiea gigantea]|uniref:Uncharacterized protein n=1 Tax=Carnegiea gigantea TaxID=171969 RepID=A0A9Q1JJX6_9CARY|nr:LOW QUALITY PROTEIN: hypothetical protein Cgig2_028214 [Carnegiea gigantea]